MVEEENESRSNRAIVVGGVGPAAAIAAISSLGLGALFGGMGGRDLLLNERRERRPALQLRGNVSHYTSERPISKRCARRLRGRSAR